MENRRSFEIAKIDLNRISKNPESLAAVERERERERERSYLDMRFAQLSHVETTGLLCVAYGNSHIVIRQEDYGITETKGKIKVRIRGKPH